MKYWGGLVILLACLLSSTTVRAQDSITMPPGRWFEPNLGQSDPQYAFISRGDALMAFFAPDEVAFTMLKPDLVNMPDEGRWTYVALHMAFAGANPNPTIVSEQILPGVSNYLRGDITLTGVPHFGRIVYQDVYPGVDMVYRLEEGILQYDFVFDPGADPSQIRLQFESSQRLEITPGGDLLIHAPHQTTLRKRAPFTFQGAGANRQQITSRFVLLDAQTVGFEVGGYDHSRTLTIDPSLIYSTFLGSETAGDTIPDLAIDSTGHAYLFGQAQGTGFPTTPGAFDETFEGPTDTFITKLSPDGSSLIYSTFLGGTNGEYGRGIAVDSADNVYVTGATQSADFPLTATAYQTSTSATIFLSRLNAAGNALVYSTRLGPGETYGIAVDNNGHAYVVGYSSSAFPTTVSAFQPALAGGSDAFLTRINTNASGAAGLVYSTFFGGGIAPSGTPNEQGLDVAIDGSGGAYIAGYTMSSDLPVTANAYDTTLGGNRDAFVARFDTNASGTASLLYSSYLGGTYGNSGPYFLGADFAHGVATDGAGNVYIIGNTYAPDYPTTAGAFDTSFNGPANAYDAFVAQFNTNASGSSSLVFSTFLGGDGLEYGWDIQLSSVGIVALGWTSSSDFPLLDPLQTGLASENVFVTHLDSLGSNLLFSTIFGGNASEHGLSLAVDSADSIYFAGFTQSSDFLTTTGAYDPTLGSWLDGFAVKIGTSLTATPTATPTATATSTATSTATATNSPTATTTPTATNTATANATQTETSTSSATATNTATSTATATATTTDTATATATVTSTATATETATNSPTAMDTLTATATSSAIATSTDTATATTTDTPTATATGTATPTNTATATSTATVTSTATATETVTPIGTTMSSATATATETPTTTSTHTTTATGTATPTATTTSTGTGTITITATATATETATITPTATVAGENPLPPTKPGISIMDPAISKIGLLQPGESGVRGERIEWVVTVTNGDLAQSLTITDTLISALQVDSVEAPGAVTNINGQRVTVSYSLLAANESVQFSIFTTVLQGVEVENTACIDSTDNCATGKVIATLPETGESPHWRILLWLGSLAALIGLYRLRHKLTTSS